MELKNKDYYVRGSRWYWYSIFLILLNIVAPLIAEVIFIIEESYEFILMIPFIISLIVLTILFIKKTINREQGFSVGLLICISILYIIYYFLFIYGIVEIQDYYEFGDFIALLIIFPFGLGPFLLFVNFIIAYKCHKNGVILANEKNNKLKLLGVISILVSLFFPFFILLLFSFKFLASTMKSVGKKGNQNRNNNNKKRCQKCGAEISVNSSYCDKCGMKIDNKNKKYCKKCGEVLNNNSNFCSKCGSKI